MIKLKETGKEYPVHKFLAEKLVKQGKAEFSKTPIESRETKGSCTSFRRSIINIL